MQDSILAMERRTKDGAQMLAILVVFVLANGVNAASLYTCWGSCYNRCFAPGSGVTQSQTQMLSCEYKCLNSCIPTSPNGLNGLNKYCEIGCSMKRCIPARYVVVGDKLKSCFGWCTNLCNKIGAP